MKPLPPGWTRADEELRERSRVNWRGKTYPATEVIQPAPYEPAPSAGQDTERLRDEVASVIHAERWRERETTPSGELADALLDGPLARLLHLDGQMQRLIECLREQRDEARAQVQRAGAQALKDAADALSRPSEGAAYEVWAHGGGAWLRARADALDPHVHGAWCHPSADGCPDRPGA